MEDARSIMKYI